MTAELPQPKVDAEQKATSPDAAEIAQAIDLDVINWGEVLPFALPKTASGEKRRMSVTSIVTHRNYLKSLNLSDKTMKRAVQEEAEAIFPESSRPQNPDLAKKYDETRKRYAKCLSLSDTKFDEQRIDWLEYENDRRRKQGKRPVARVTYQVSSPDEDSPEVDTPDETDWSEVRAAYLFDDVVRHNTGRVITVEDIRTARSQLTDSERYVGINQQLAGAHGIVRDWFPDATADDMDIDNPNLTAQERAEAQQRYLAMYTKQQNDLEAALLASDDEFADIQTDWLRQHADHEVDAISNKKMQVFNAEYDEVVEEYRTALAERLGKSFESIFSRKDIESLQETLTDYLGASMTYLAEKLEEKGLSQAEIAERIDQEILNAHACVLEEVEAYRLEQAGNHNRFVGWIAKQWKKVRIDEEDRPTTFGGVLKEAFATKKGLARTAAMAAGGAAVGFAAAPLVGGIAGATIVGALLGGAVRGVARTYATHRLSNIADEGATAGAQRSQLQAAFNREGGKNALQDGTLSHVDLFEIIEHQTDVIRRTNQKRLLGSMAVGAVAGAFGGLLGGAARELTQNLFNTAAGFLPKLGPENNATATATPTSSASGETRTASPSPGTKSPSPGASSTPSSPSSGSGSGAARGGGNGEAFPTWPLPKENTLPQPTPDVPDVSAPESGADTGLVEEQLTNLSQEAQTISRGEGMFQNFKDHGIAREHWGDLMKIVGPKLDAEYPELVYKEGAAWYLDYNKGTMPEGASRIILAAAQENGMLNLTPEADVTAELPSVDKGEGLNEFVAENYGTTLSAEDSIEAGEALHKNGDMYKSDFLEQRFGNPYGLKEAGPISKEADSIIRDVIDDGEINNSYSAVQPEVTASNETKSAGTPEIVRATPKEALVDMKPKIGAMVDNLRQGNVQAINNNLDLQGTLQTLARSLSGMRYPNSDVPIMRFDSLTSRWIFSDIPAGSQLPEKVESIVGEYLQSTFTLAA